MLADALPKNQGMNCVRIDAEQADDGFQTREKTAGNQYTIDRTDGDRSCAGLRHPVEPVPRADVHASTLHGPVNLSTYMR